MAKFSLVFFDFSIILLIFASSKDNHKTMVEAQKKNVRNTNIEILRFVLMVFICFWHVIVHGYCFKFYGEPGFVLNADIKIITFFTTLFAPATYCFMFISGWYGIKYSLRKYLYFAFLAICCMVLTIGIRFYLGDIDSWYPVVSHIFPIATEKWWFLTCYIMVFLIAPFIEAGMKVIDPKMLKQIVYIMTFIEVGSLMLQEPTGLSFFGLLYIYFLARYLRMIQFDCSTRKLIIAYLVAFIALWALSYGASYLGGFKWIAWILAGSYNNPAIIIMAITTFFLVNKIKPTHIGWLNRIFENVLIIYLLTEGVGPVLYKYEAGLISSAPLQGILFVLATVLCCLVIGKVLALLYSFVSKAFPN